MMRTKWWWTSLALLILLFVGSPPQAKEFNEKRARKYLNILLKRPGNEYLMEKVYTSYAGAGKTDYLISLLQKEIKENESSAPCLILGQIYQRNFRHEKAIEFYKLATQRSPKSFTAHLLLGKAYVANNKTRKAIKALEKAIPFARRTREKRDTLKILGKLYYDETEHEKALKVWKKIPRVGRITGTVLKELLTLYEEHQFYKEAIKTAKEVIRRSPSNLRLRFRMRLKLAHLYKEVGEFKKSAALYRKVFNSTSKGHWLRAEATKGLFALYSEAGRLDELKRHYEKKIKGNPRDSENYILLAKVMRLQQEGLNYEEFLRKSVKKFPKEVVFYTYLLEYYEEMDNVKRYMDTLKSLFNLRPNRTDLVLKGCQIYLERKEFKKARGLASLLIQKHPTDGHEYYQLAKLFHRYKQSKSALEFARKALKFSPRNRRIITLAGKVFLENKKKKKALEIWKGIAPPGTTDPYLLYELAQVLHRHQLYEESIKVIDRALAKNPLQFKLLYLKALCLRKLDREKEAMVAFRKAYEKAQSTMEKNKVRKSLIEVYAQAGLLKKLIEEFGGALEKAKGKKKKITLLEALAEMEERAGNQKRAIKLYEELIALNGQHIEARKSLARLYALSNNKRDYKKAITHYLKLVELHPTKKARYYLAVGEIYLENLKDKSQALKYLKKARNSQPMWSSICFEIAKIYLELKDYDQAEKLLVKTVKELNGNKAEYREVLARIYFRKKKYEEALELHEKILRLKSATQGRKQQSYQEIYKISLILGEKYRREGKLESEARLYKRILDLDKSLQQKWDRSIRASLLCRLVLVRSKMKDVKPRLIVNPIQTVVSQYRSRLVKLEEDYSVNAFLFCQNIFHQLSDKYRQYYELQFGRKARNLTEKALKYKSDPYLARALYEEIINQRPFSKWAGFAALKLAESHGDKGEALFYLQKIVQGRVQAEEKVVNKALVKYYQIKKKLGQGREGFEFLSAFKDRKKVASLLKKEAPNYPKEKKYRWKTTPPLAEKWAGRIGRVRYGAPAPIFHKGRLFYPKDHDTLYCYELDEGHGGYVDSEGQKRSYVSFPMETPDRVRYFNYFGGSIYKDLLLYGGTKLVAYDLDKKNQKWAMDPIAEKIDLELQSGQTYQARLKSIFQDRYTFLLPRGKRLVVLKKEIASMTPREITNPAVKQIQALKKKLEAKDKEVRKLRKIYLNDRGNRKKVREYQNAYRELRRLKSHYRRLSRRVRYRNYRWEALYTQPIVHDNRLYVYEGVNQWLICAEADTGELIWLRKLNLGGRYQNSQSRSFPSYLRRIVPQMEIHGDSLYFLADHLYSFSRDQGQIQWKRHFGLYGSNPSPLSYVLLKDRIYVSFRKSRRRGVLVFDLQGKKHLYRKMSRAPLLLGRGDKLCAITGRGFEIFQGKSLEKLKGGASVKFPRSSSYSRLNLYLNRETLATLSGDYLYIVVLGWLQAYHFNKDTASLKMVWEDEETKKKVKRKSSSSRHSRRYRFSRYRSKLLGPFLHEGSLYVIDGTQRKVFAYKSMRDVEQEIFARIKKNPKDHEAYLRLAALHLRGKNYPQAIRYYKKVLSMKSSASAREIDKAKKSLFEIYYLQGREKLPAAKYSQAKKFFLNAGKYAPTREAEIKVKLLQSWILDQELRRHWHYWKLTSSITRDFWGIAPLVPSRIEKEKEAVLVSYLKALRENKKVVLSIPIDKDHDESFQSRSFVIRNLGHLLSKIEGMSKLYEKMIKNHAKNAFQRARRASEYLEVYRRFPLSTWGARSLFQAAEKYEKGRKFAYAHKVLLRLREDLEIHSSLTDAYKKVLWKLGEINYKLKNYQKALAYFLKLEYDYLRKGEFLSWKREQALAEATIDCEDRILQNRMVTPSIRRKWKASVNRFYYTYRFLQPVVLEDKIFAMHRYRGLMAWDTKRGQRKRFSLRRFSRSYPHKAWSPYKLVKSSTHVFCHVGNLIRALDARNLKWDWSYRDDDIDTSLPQGARFEFRLVVSEPYLFALSTTGHLYAFQADTGKLLWKRKINQRTYALDYRRHYYSDRYPALVASEGKVAVIGDKILCYQGLTGQRLWKKSLSEFYPTSLKSNVEVYDTASISGRILVSLSTGWQFALNWEKGKLLWKNDSGTGKKAKLSVTPHSVVALTIEDRNDFFIEKIDLWTGKKEVRSQLKNPHYKQVRGKPLALVHNSTYVYIFYDRFYIYDLRNVKEKIIEDTQLQKKRKIQEVKRVWKSSYLYRSNYYIAPKPLLYKGRLYMVEPDGELNAYESSR